MSGCDGNAEPGMAFPPPEVNVALITPQDLPVEREYIGQTKGSREVEIRPRVGGIIEKRLYEEGSRVAAGKVLFQLDPKPSAAKLAVAEAALARAQAQYRQAERDLNRLKPLAEDKLISRKALDDAQSAFELAEADVKAAEASAREARLQLDYTRVTAPIAGIAGLAEKVEGAVVSASEDRLTTLTDTDPMDVYFSMSENELLAQQTQLADGTLQSPSNKVLQVKVRLADGRLPDRIGRINFNDARIDTSTGTLSMRARLQNADGLLKSGQFVRVISTGAVRPNAMTVPQKAVLEGPQGKFVYVINQDKAGNKVAAIRPIQVGEWVTQNNERAWLVLSGLNAGDQVILDNLIKIGPDVPVQIAPPATPVTTAPAVIEPQQG
ncbi:MAG TPA: efflux RND transporter periplasmic adaptor subunit [Gammaproteobacteria bacterium]|nr:efflux RND transporter periplasmic adaptor subunit [Gammaproteobacteria bacterium]